MEKSRYNRFGSSQSVTHQKCLENRELPDQRQQKELSVFLMSQQEISVLLQPILHCN